MRGKIALGLSFVLGFLLLAGSVVSLMAAPAEDDYQSLENGLYLLDLSEDSLASNFWDDGTNGIAPYWVQEIQGSVAPGGGGGAGPGLDPTAEQTDPWCLDRAHDVHNPPDDRDHEWKPFTPFNPNGYQYTTKWLKFDRYNPPTPGTYPILLIFHGGAWLRGCRWLLDDVAYNAARDTAGVGQKFIALSVDYRVACDPNGQYVNDPTEELFLMCGWHFTTEDPAVPGQTMVAMHDVQVAVVWAKANIPTGPCDGYCWDGQRLYVAGGSAGGKLAQMAALFSTTNGTPNNRPTATAAWSPFPELTKMSHQGGPNFVFGCTNTDVYPFETSDSVGCWQAVDNYLDPGLCQPQVPAGPDPNCKNAQGESYYQLASPWHYVNDDDKLNIVPLFFANGGGPVAGATPTSPPPGSTSPSFQSSPELVALQSEDDLLGRMFRWDVTKRLECTVNTNLHGAAYLTVKPCNDGSNDSVWRRTLSFLLLFP